MATRLVDEPKIASAEACETTALDDFKVGSILAVTSMVNASFAALEINPNYTTPVAVAAGIMSVPFIVNGFLNASLAKKHRAGISVPG